MNSSVRSETGPPSETGLLQPNLARLRTGLGALPGPVARPVLVVVSGLPGTGKSYFSRRLAQRLPLVILETDLLRRTLFTTPTYTAQESARLFQACHSLIQELLQQGVCVLLDATNLQEGYREWLYTIAERAGARVILVRVGAPPELVFERLARRTQGKTPEDHSEAGWDIYRRMQDQAQPIRRAHLAVDTSRDIEPVVQKVVREARRWMRP